MNFKEAVDTREVQTTNGMTSYKGTGDEVLNFFSSVGGRRGQDNIELFKEAFQDNSDLAVRALLWSRDIRGGAGERETFRQCLVELSKTDLEICKAIIRKTPEVGRWDDLLVLFGTPAEAFALDEISKGLKNQNGLCAKWMPRKGRNAETLRNYLGYSPKRYRKTLVTLSQTVEQKMCAKEFEQIELEKVPSLAGIRYRNAFTRHIPEKVQEFAQKVKSGEVQVNAQAVYPHQITMQFKNELTKDQKIILEAQWKNLPDYVPENSSVLPMVDVSGSMECPAGGNSKVRCVDISIALGIYLASKNTGVFKDLFLTFESEPRFVRLKGDLEDRIYQTINSGWGYSTNIQKAFEEILKVAKNGNVPKEDMPKTLIIFSDMQFDQASKVDVKEDYNPSAKELVKEMYNQAGYDVPNIVFWNLNDHENKAAKKDDLGVALVSGFSPSLIKPILENDFSEFEKFTPMNLMLEVLNSERYDY